MSTNMRMRRGFCVLVYTTDDASEVVVCDGVAGNIDEGLNYGLHYVASNLFWAGYDILSSIQAHKSSLPRHLPANTTCESCASTPSQR